MSRPKLLLIDEASLGLSPKLTSTVFEVVRRINSDGTTVFMVEQNAGVLAYADRAFVMEKGQIVYEGAGDQILDHSEIRQAYLGAPA
jgi:branched-chain amino acid transport system ATP-binding protein